MSLVGVCISCVEPEGPLMGGPQEMTMSPVTIFVDFLSIKNSPMLPVDFRKWQCPLSRYFKLSYRFQCSLMSPVEFQKRPCRPVEFKGQWPYQIEPKVQCQLSNIIK